MKIEGEIVYLTSDSELLDDKVLLICLAAKRVIYHRLTLGNDQIATRKYILRERLGWDIEERSLSI